MRENWANTKRISLGYSSIDREDNERARVSIKARIVD